MYKPSNIGELSCPSQAEGLVAALEVQRKGAPQGAKEMYRVGHAFERRCCNGPGPIDEVLLTELMQVDSLKQ